MAIVFVSPGGLAIPSGGGGGTPDPAFDRTVTIGASSAPVGHGFDRVPGFPGFGYGAISNASFGGNNIVVARYLNNSPTINFNLRMTTPSLTPAPAAAFEAISLEWSGGFVVFERADADDPAGATSGINRTWLWSISAAEVRWTAADIGITYDFGIK